MKRSSIVALAVLLAIGIFVVSCDQAESDLSATDKSLDGKYTAPKKSHRPAELNNLVSYPKDDGSWIPYAPGEVVVKFRSSVSAAQVEQGLGAELGLTRVKRRSQLGVDRMKLTTKESVESAVARLKKDPRVLYAEPNWKIRLTNTPNDARFEELWGMHNTGQTGGTEDVDIDAPEAWDISIGSYNVIVAVLDTGVDYNHPDLAANIWENEDEIAGNGIDDDNNGYIDDIRGWDFEYETNDPMDNHSHGTHCSGTIGGVGNNGIGVAGVNWRVTIMPVRIIGSQDLETYCTDASEGVTYAAANGADVMSCSWWTVQHPCQTLQDAVTYAEGQGSIIVAAAANEYADVDGPNMEVWPCEYANDNIICVAAIDHNNNKADFSNWGAISVDVAAPGVDTLSTTPGNSYGTKSGTSMACPHTAGVVALMLSLNPDLTAAEVKNILFTTVDPVPDLQAGGSYPTITGGRINAYRALQVLSGVPLPPVALAGGNQTVVTGNTVQLDGSNSFDPNQDPITHLWDFYPPQHSSASLDDNQSATPTFFADVCGDYQAILTVNDGTFDSDPDTARVYVRNINSSSVESEHPYLDNTDQTWTITHPGAVTMSVHFSSFDTESGYDFVRLLDGNDLEWASYSGSLGEFTSLAIDGNTIKIHFTSDGSVVRDGFIIDSHFWCDAGNCPPGTGDCDENPANGCEVDTTDDVNNCGWCGHACVYQHASSTCEQGLCQIGSCDSGWTDCDSIVETGCESDILVDPINCGGCGTICGPYDNAVPGCQAGSCIIAECAPGWDDCDGLLSNGCERNVSADTDNCGACNNICALDHAVGHVCIDGICYPMGACSTDPETIETVHPYVDNFDYTWTITKAGAAEISVHFTGFDVESGWDFVYIYDANDLEFERYSGTLGDFQSISVPGQTIKIRLTTDGSVQRFGFVIDSVYYCASGCENDWGNCDAIPENGCEADLLTDLDHCGGCGQLCGLPHTNGECIDGVCIAGSECSDGWGDCDGESQNGCEADLTSDPNHCSGCNLACVYDHAVDTCLDSQCVMGDCDAGWGDCNNNDADGCEMDILFDTDNCGSCGNVCALPNVGDHLCDNGICYPGNCTTEAESISTPHNYTDNFNQTWVITHPGTTRIRVFFTNFDTESNYDYVYIFNADDVLMTTYDGPLGDFYSIWVQGETIKVNLVTDGSMVRYGFDIFSYDQCSSGCLTGYADCDGLPDSGCESDVSADPDNCGSCGNSCSYPNAYGVCTAGECSLGACHDGWFDCDGDPQTGCEIYILTDVDNCGGCDQICLLDNAQPACVEGGCIIAACNTGFDNCDSNPLNGCEADVSSDPSNCGGCGTICDFDNASATCVDSACVMGACDSGFQNCDSNPDNGCEVEVANDPANCGSCGTICSFDNAHAGCSSGNCTIDSCDTGFDNCDGQIDNGCEADVSADPNNCGACNTVCAFDNAAVSCVDNSCVLGVCDTGFGNCDQVDASGCESEFAIDPANCGACDVICAFDNATANCSAGNCSMGDCNQGFADCDQNTNNGCEVDTDNDPNNCSSCGNVCVFDNAAANCQGGACLLGDCDEGFADCDQNSANGCETDLADDSDNCGACDNVCDFANASATCTDSNCILGTCDQGYGDCDGLAANGCEIDLANDTNHCGACANACTNGQECAAGQCACRDADNDGYGTEPCGTDCDDSDAEINPGTDEICGDDIDQDCDGVDLACTCADADKCRSRL
ncbi:MAG: S8 family serine peptidase [Deltaproteobacteria bacterium]|nr:S8 family serine peptidase [Deltaproteobacteria bacterium]